MTGPVVRCVAVALFAGVLLLGPAGPLGAAEPEALLTYAGDGLTVFVDEMSEETGAVRGRIRRGADVYPFTGTIAEDGDAEVVRGTFTADKAKHAFTSRQEDGSDVVSFTTGNKTFRLRPTDAADEQPAKPERANPLDGDADAPADDADKEMPAEDDDKPTPSPAPLDGDEDAPAGDADKEMAAEEGDEPARGDAGDAAPAAKLPEVMRLKRHVFPDVTMGVPAAYAVTMPEGWTAKGNIEWSGGELSYPQTKIEINSPEKGRIHFIPAVTLTYTESKPIAGFPQTPPEGVPAPEDFPRWFVSAVGQTNKKVSNVELITSRREKRIEEMDDKRQRDIGANDEGTRREAHVVTFEYDEAGVRRREEASMMYVRYPPIDNQAIYSQTWSIFTMSQVSAPKERFEALKPQLYRIAGAVGATPQWWTQSQALLAELSRVRVEDRWKSIRRRGEMITRVSDDDYRRYKDQMTSGGDAAQRDRINTIYETDDFRDANGDIVNLPMHYQHVYSDGNGNYVLSNNSLNKPGESWNEIQTVK